MLDDDEKKYDIYKIDVAHITDGGEAVISLFNGHNGNGNYYNLHGRWYYGHGCKMPNEFITLIE